ncbi:MAG: dehypoxanthine futalosine cyclase [Desulfovibrio sp.]|nr:dehypoxanthine futalosine cyclase [Desulfovibrio sp.]
MIRKSGFTPVRRNAVFTPVEKAAPTVQTPFTHAHSPFNEPAGIASAVAKAKAGERLDRADAEALYYQASLPTLAHLANAMRQRLHPEPVVTFVGDRNINYSNQCVCACRFCAFFRAPDDPEGYVITREEMAKKIDETLALGGTQILLQGGHNPLLPFSWYEDLLCWMRATWPTLHIHAFSPPEIFYWSRLYAMPVAEIIRRLRAAGLDSIPGGGAEILVNEVRARVSPNKCTADEWLAVMEEAHNQGMKTTATMMFGHEEEPGDRLSHLFAVRGVQDRTHGFTAFIPWTFQPGNTRISCRPLPSPAYLRMLAVSRLVLDNVPNIQASWVTMGPDVAQLALFYGANDFGSLMIEENVVAAAGVSYSLTRRQIHGIIRAAGFTPVQRTMDYTPVDPQPAL